MNARPAPSPEPDGSRFHDALMRHGLRLERTAPPEILQINLGKYCNQACQHCHVDAGPKRPERMAPATAERILALLERSPFIHTVDITGGAPEFNTSFRLLTKTARALGREVIDRSNLTVLCEPGQEDTAEFLARHGVRIVASLPCYTAENVERQRGEGVFTRSLEALHRLNSLGYGAGDGLVLDLVYNPLGPSLPPAPETLEPRYREELGRLGVRFDHLLVMTNLPIHRFRHALVREGRLETYEALLESHFNPATVAHLMCRTTLSVSWDGKLYDCDFHQMTETPLPGGEDLWSIDDFGMIGPRPIALRRHCFGCTAGRGSSCGGTLA